MDIDKKYNVKIGEVKIIKNSNETVWTILGSCIAVIFHVRKDLALICHAQSPYPMNHANECSGACPCLTNLFDKKRFKYISCSLEYMISYLKRNKIDLKSIKTSLLGGASVLNHYKKTKSFGDINVTKAKQILKKHGIRIHREVTGGDEGITLMYSVKNNRLIFKEHTKEEFVDIY